MSAVASATALDETSRFTAQKLRVYCKACHAVGDLKFIHSENDENLWWDILHAKAPSNGELWAKRIVELLDWPTDDAPPGEQPKWMPKGKKRELLAEDYESGLSTRRVMIGAIRKALKSPSVGP